MDMLQVMSRLGRAAERGLCDICTICTMWPSPDAGWLIYSNSCHSDTTAPKAHPGLLQAYLRQVAAADPLD